MTSTASGFVHSGQDQNVPFLRVNWKPVELAVLDRIRFLSRYLLSSAFTSERRYSPELVHEERISEQADRTWIHGRGARTVLRL